MDSKNNRIEELIKLYQIERNNQEEEKSQSVMKGMKLLQNNNDELAT